MKTTLLAVAVCLAAQGLYAQGHSSREEEKTQRATVLAGKYNVGRQEIEEATTKAGDEATKQIAGIKFGMAIGATLGEERIDEAQVIDGTVRITKGSRGEPALWLETHFLVPFGATTVTRNVKLSNGVMTPVEADARRFGVGPFVAVQSSTDGLLDAIAGGVLFGVRRPGSDSGSLNVGVGGALLPKFQVLGDGITANQPLPGNETEIRYRTKSQWRFIVMFSFAF